MREVKRPRRAKQPAVFPVKNISMQLASRVGSADGPVTIHGPGCQLIEHLLRNGHPMAVAAQRVGLGVRELKAVAKRLPEVDQAITAGLGALEAELVHTLLEAAREGNTKAAEFLLKTRFAYRENGAGDSSLPSVAVQINLPGALPVQNYIETIEEAAHEPDA